MSTPQNPKPKKHVTPRRAALDSSWGKNLSSDEFPGWDFVTVGNLELIREELSELTIVVRRILKEASGNTSHPIADGMLAAIKVERKSAEEMGHIELMTEFARMIHSRGAMTADQLGDAVGMSRTKVKNRLTRSPLFRRVTKGEFPPRYDLTEHGREIFELPSVMELPAWESLAEGSIG